MYEKVAHQNIYLELFFLQLLRCYFLLYPVFLVTKSKGRRQLVRIGNAVCNLSSNVKVFDWEYRIQETNRGFSFILFQKCFKVPSTFVFPP